MHFPLFVATLVALASATNVATPLSIPFNNTHYFGYNGPWQAIPVLLSEPQQLVNLFPGGSYATAVLSTHVTNFEGAYPDAQQFPTDSGIFDAALAEPHNAYSTQNYYIYGPNEGGTIGAVDGAWNGGPAEGLSGMGLLITDQLMVAGVSVSNVSLSAVYNASYLLPDGRNIPLDVGFLSLGAANNQFYSPWIGEMVPLNLSATGTIPSNTWGLHIGSVYPSIPGSLVFGGFDQSRVIGNPSKLKTDALGTMVISLIDISIGVAAGGSPFPFTNKTGLLQNNGGSNQPINTRPNPTVPYLYLPDDTCKAIAANLPVTYLPSLDLYAWNTSSHNFTDVVTSPSYLGFTFALPPGAGNLTINVPFSLLNLTLTPPLVDSPVQYFPCKSYDPSTSEAPTEYQLGRAFLQAAFIGMNWHDEWWWMAQAPGPSNLYVTVQSLYNDTDTINPIGDSSAWANSWESVWTPLPLSNGEIGGGGSLSTGAKAGIAVGAVVAVLIVLVAVLFFLRRAKRSRAGRTQWSGDTPEASKALYRRSSNHKPELDDTSTIFPIYTGQAQPQLQAQPKQHYELDAY